MSFFIYIFNTNIKIYSEWLHWASLASCGVISITTHIYWYWASFESCGVISITTHIYWFSGEGTIRRGRFGASDSARPFRHWDCSARPFRRWHHSALGCFPPFPANRGSSRLTCAATNLCSRRYVILGGDNIKLRAKRARLQQTNRRRMVSAPKRPGAETAAPKQPRRNGGAERS